MNHRRVEKILQRIGGTETSFRVHTNSQRTVPVNILAPVAVFAQDHLRTGVPGAWLSVHTIRGAFYLWLREIGWKDRVKDYNPVLLGRCLSQVLDIRSERRIVRKHQVRGLPVWPKQQDGDDFFLQSYE